MDSESSGRPWLLPPRTNRWDAEKSRRRFAAVRPAAPSVGRSDLPEKAALHRFLNGGSTARRGPGEGAAMIRRATSRRTAVGSYCLPEKTALVNRRRDGGER